MKLKWTSNNKNIIKFLISLFIIGLIIGIFIYLKQPSVVKKSILNELSFLGEALKSTRQNNFVYHLVLFSILIVLSIFVLGLPLLLFYLFYEGISIGFLIASFFHYQKMSGLMYSFILIIVNKLVFYLVLIYIMINTINFSKKMYQNIKTKNRYIQEHVFLQLVKNGFAFALILIYDVFIYFFGNKILAYFLFLL